MNRIKIRRHDAVAQARAALRGMELARRKAAYDRTGSTADISPTKARRLTKQPLRRSA